MAIHLRKKAPFHCRYPLARGTQAFCLAVLTDADTNYCAAHEAAHKAAHEKFWNPKPAAPRASAEPAFVKPAHWPFWP